MRYFWVLVVLILISCGSVDKPQTSSPNAQSTIQTPSLSEFATPVSSTNTASLATENEAAAFEQLRLEMVEESIKAWGVSDSDVLRVMQAVPRHFFVPSEHIDLTYRNHPLPIGYGQTISQPFMVAWMTELLELKSGDKVLEIGTGSGYQAAVLAELGFVEVYSIEIVPELAEFASNNLEKAGYDKVYLKQGDGYYGWEEFAPFDAIIVTAAPDHLPLPLVEQLAEGGRIVIPIGPPGYYQTLWQFKYEKGELVAINLGGVSFVPFTGEGTSSSESAEP